MARCSCRRANVVCTEIMEMCICEAADDMCENTQQPAASESDDELDDNRQHSVLHHTYTTLMIIIWWDKPILLNKYI